MKKLKFNPKILMIILFFLMICVLPVITVLLPKEKFSENENRYLAAFPSLVNDTKMEKAENLVDVLGAVKWNSLTDKSFEKGFETYITDYFAGRESWIKMKNSTEKVIGKQEINGIFTVKDQMIQAFNEYDKDAVQKSIDAVNAFSERHSEIPVYFMLAPTSQEIFSSFLPQTAGLSSQKSFIDHCYGSMKSISSVDVLSTLNEHRGEYIYYRTDHHWTSYGAFLAYSQLAKKLGYTAYDYGSFEIEHASNNFRGTLYSKTLDESITPDIIDYYYLTNGEPKVRVTVTGESIDEYDSMYFRDFLEKKDKYSSYLGSNAPIVTIETDVHNSKSLLVIKDSYAHCLVPFLSKHYSKITMIDMRYINTNYEQLVKVEDYSQVLFAYNVVTFASDDNIKKLNFAAIGGQ